jgi:TRAP-type C4-dicarboxylate transport system permease small subunit
LFTANQAQTAFLCRDVSTFKGLAQVTAIDPNVAQRLMKRLLEYFLIFLMVMLTAVVVVAVLYRITGDSLSWYDEVAAILLSWVTYYGACLAALERKHIGVDSILLVMPVKLRVVGMLVAEVMVIGFFILLAWAGLTVLEILEGETLVSLTWVPIQFTQSVIPVTAILFIICELLSIPAYWRETVAGNSLNDH